MKFAKKQTNKETNKQTNKNHQSSNRDEKHLPNYTFSGFFSQHIQSEYHSMMCRKYVSLNWMVLQADDHWNMCENIGFSTSRPFFTIPFHKSSHFFGVSPEAWANRFQAGPAAYSACAWSAPVRSQPAVNGRWELQKHGFTSQQKKAATTTTTTTTKKNLVWIHAKPWEWICKKKGFLWF